MKNTLIAILFFITFVGKAQELKTLPEKFYTTCWAASFEEDDKSTAIKNYRLCENRTLSNKVFRERYVFKKDGTCQVLIPDGTGTQYYEDCKWTINSQSGIVEITNAKGKYTSRFIVVEVKDDLMRIKVLK